MTLEITDLFPDAKPISFDEIMAGDTVARTFKGKVVVGEAATQSNRYEWLNSDRSVVCCDDSPNLHLVDRPEKTLPEKPQSAIWIEKECRYGPAGTIGIRVFGGWLFVKPSGESERVLDKWIREPEFKEMSFKF